MKSRTKYWQRFWLKLLSPLYRLACWFSTYVNMKQEELAVAEQIPLGTRVRIGQCSECTKRQYIPDGHKSFGVVIRSYVPDYSAYEVKIDNDVDVYVHAEHVFEVIGAPGTVTEGT